MEEIDSITLVQHTQKNLTKAELISLAAKERAIFETKM